MKITFSILFCTILNCGLFAQKGSKTQPVEAKVSINTRQGGHPIVVGSSGFNTRIGDKVWSYKHPDFVKAVNELRPGWLRFWSGTAGDAFCAATGQYDQEYISMFDKGEAYDRLYQFVEVKGPHRLMDLYQLMGSIGGKVVITVNAFTETPEMTAELARFCKNNHIKVEAWQFCNEPYFYIPSRQRYWWNNGFDYAQKMKPHADAIHQIFPDAHLALNFTWDGIWTFMKEINQYQKERGAFWNTFSKHSYAPHTGKEESFANAYKRLNTKLLEATSPEGMKEIENWTQKDIPMLITEFGVWNRPLNGIMSAVYNAEYTLRQLSHTNTWLIGSHEISNKAKPVKNFNKEITNAFEKNTPLSTEQLETGVELDDEGKAFKILHEATNNSDYIWATKLTGGAMVDGMNNEKVEGLFALSFQGTNDYDYLALTNRSDKWHGISVSIDGKKQAKTYTRTWMAGEQAEAKNVEIQADVVKNTEILHIPPFSSMLVKWEKSKKTPPQYSRIYKAENRANGLFLKWWKRPEASDYQLKILNKNTGKMVVKDLKGTANDTFLFKEAQQRAIYECVIIAKNKAGDSKPSETITLAYTLPDAPLIFKIAPRGNQLTVFWRSVANTNGYKVQVKSEDGSFQKEYDADNVFGYKIYDLPMDKPCQVSVVAYNGLGKSAASEVVNFICKKNIPLPPSNISAIENEKGGIDLTWVAPKQQNTEGVLYRLYRGEKPHDFMLLKEGISEITAKDETVVAGKDYFYTVKSYTLDGGECSFYPNIATVIKSNKKTSLKVVDITKNTEGFNVQVQYNNLPTDGEVEYGILISDVSYLNGEETVFKAANGKNGVFTIQIPLKDVKSKATYAVKAYVKTNGGTPTMSLPPHKEFKVN
jgi:hypothetical protein